MTEEDGTALVSAAEADAIFEDARTVWDYFDNPEKGNKGFFDAVKIDEAAGFDEIADLQSWTRYLSTLISFVFLAMNTYDVLRQNSSFVSAGTETSAGDVYLITADLLGGNIRGQFIVGCIELTVMGLWYSYGFYLLLDAACLTSSQCRRWRSISEFCLQVFPVSVALSAVKLLNYTTPQVLVPDLLLVIGRLTEEGTGALSALLWFLISRVLCFYIGFDVFLFKFQKLAQDLRLYVENEDYMSSTDLLIAIAVFLNQMIGVVQLNIFVRDRLFLFIFAGEDGALSKKETSVKSLWEAMFFEACWRQLGMASAISFFLTFSDADFQKLALDSTGKGLSDVADLNNNEEEETNDEL